jgi:Zn-dependent M28 family amino/carboxypeptidase
MKILFLLLGFSFLATLTANAATFESSYKIKDHVKHFGRKTIIKELRGFVNAGGRGRMVGTDGHKSARLYLINKLKITSKGTNSTVRVQQFEPNTAVAQKMYLDDFNTKIVGKFPNSSPMYKKWNKFTKYMSALVGSYKTVDGHNIIWEKKGRNDKEVLLIGAHYDTISHNKKSLEVTFGELMPGADYNASGVTVALGIIDRLSKIDLDRTVRVVFFDYQGFGVLGAEHYVSSIESEKKKIIGLINLEMLGHDSKSLDKTKRNGNMAVYLRDPSVNKKGYDQDQKVLRVYDRYNSKCRGSVKFKVKPNGFTGSDHVRFWEKGIGAITFSQDWEDDFNERGYQTKNDFVETINQSTLFSSYKTIACVVLHWASDL